MPAAIARPDGAGPYPAVVVLHGSHGFAREYVQLATDLSSGGIIAVAACWFSGGVGAGKSFITPIDCPAGPPMARAPDPSALQAVDTIVRAVHTLPGVRADRIGVFGHSRGGGAALHYAIAIDNVQAVALNSTGYPSDLANRVSDLKAPILMLHGNADSAADGGSPMSDVKMARHFEAALRRAGARVKAHYYATGRHNGIFADPQQYGDALQRMKSFFAGHLSE
jgi:dienelactone hydrolase